MRVIIAGSRSIKEMDVLKEAIRLSNYEITEVVSGGAGGVDSLGEEWALNNRIPCKAFPVEGFEWEWSKKAGLDRNVRMAHYADALIAVWDGVSSGTKHMIDTMRALGKLVYVYVYDPNR